MLGAMRTQTAKNVCKILMEKVICTYGLLDAAFAHVFVSDNGRNLTGAINTELCRMLKLKRVTSTFYHASGNGQVERKFRDITVLLNKLTLDHPKTWYEYVPLVQAALNSAVCQTTGFSPFELLHGENMSFPTNNQLQTGFHAPVAAPECVQDWKCRLNYIRELAIENTKRAQVKQAHYYDKRSKPPKIQIGSEVMIHTPRYNLDVESRKLHSHYTGHFQVVRFVSSTNVLLRSMTDHKLLPYSIHISKLRLIGQRPEHLTDDSQEQTKPDEDKTKIREVTRWPQAEEFEEDPVPIRPRNKNMGIDAPGQEEGTMTQPEKPTITATPNPFLMGRQKIDLRSSTITENTNERTNLPVQPAAEGSGTNDNTNTPDTHQHSEDFFEIKKIHYGKMDPNTQEKSYYVSWKGYPKKYNGWVKAEDLDSQTLERLQEKPPRMVTRK